jgi:hypothetical protein
MQPVFWKAFMFSISVKLKTNEKLTNIWNKGNSSRELPGKRQSPLQSVWGIFKDSVQVHYRLHLVTLQ